MASTGRSRWLIPFAAAALTGSGVALLSFTASGQRTALASPPPARLASAVSGASCTLPVGQQIKAVKAFQEMMPVFRHPRCFNCHGGFDITDSTRHAGADFVPEGVNPRALLTVGQRKDLHEQCDLCHTEVRGTMTRLDGTRLAGWMVAPQPMLWNGKSDERLCLDMKRLEENGDSFVSHVQTDHGEVQFIEAAYHGVRALSPKERTREGIVPQPPPGNQSDLVAKARKWKQLLGGHWKEPPECGCVLPKIKLQVRHRSEMDPSHPTHRSGWVGFSGTVDFEVTMTPVHEAQGRIWYQGEKSVVRPLQVYYVARGCRGTASEKEDWLWSAEVDSASDQMKLQWGFTTSEEKGEGVCITGGYRSRAALNPYVFGGGNDEPLLVPLESGATGQFTAKEEQGSGQEWLTVKVMAVPE